MAEQAAVSEKAILHSSPSPQPPVPLSLLLNCSISEQGKLNLCFQLGWGKAQGAPGPRLQSRPHHHQMGFSQPALRA